MNILQLVRKQSENSGVILSLCRRSSTPPLIVPCDLVKDPYMGCGSHPDIVARVWDELGKGTVTEGRLIVCATPVLANPETGLILAVSYGTSYCIRIAPFWREDAIRSGCARIHKWSDGTVTDIQEEFGSGWMFGGWAAGEHRWIG